MGILMDLVGGLMDLLKNKDLKQLLNLQVIFFLNEWIDIFIKKRLIISVARFAGN